MGEPTELLRKKLGDADAVTELCAQIEGDIAALRAKYEQYFLGIERKPPTTEHEALKRKVNGLRNTFVRQFATKFRVEAVTNKLTTYERLWTRTLQEIEAGTYQRHLFKLKMHAKKDDQAERAEKERVAKAAKAADAAQKKPEAGAEAPVAGAVAPAPAPTIGASVKPAVPAGVPAAPPGPASPGQLSDQKVKAIFDAYVLAKKRCNEDVSKLSLDSMSQTLRKQVPALMKQHNAKSVEFKVVIKDGKAILRALPKDT